MTNEPLFLAIIVPVLTLLGAFLAMRRELAAFQAEMDVSDSLLSTSGSMTCASCGARN
jgi:hypothetical protein